VIVPIGLIVVLFKIRLALSNHNRDQHVDSATSQYKTLTFSQVLEASEISTLSRR
jgi:hypothetical protein